MTKRLALVLTLLAFAATGVTASTLGAVLTGSQEVPDPGDPDAFGHSTVVFNEARTEVTITTVVGGIESVTAAHIHTGVAGVPGPVLIGFASGSMPFVNGASVTLPVDPEVANAILANPSGYYVNLHNGTFPNGAVRGQLSSQDTTMFGGSMSGDREAPGPGDEDGRGAFLITLDDSRTQLTFDVVVEGIGTSFTGAHIHTGTEGVPGGVLVTLMSSTHQFMDGRLSGTITIPAEVGMAIAASPESHYVNVHTSQFTGGAVRGQLGTVEEVSLAAIGRANGALGELFVTDTRIFNPSFTDEITVMFEFYRSGMPSLLATDSTSFTIPPRGTMILNDVVGEGLLGTTGFGAARLTSNYWFVASSRIFDDRRAAGNGTIGQFFPGLPHAAEIRRGVIPGLAVTGPNAEIGSFRTNIGFFNPHAHTVTVHIDLNAPDGSDVAEHVTMTLGPMEHRQRPLGEWLALPAGDLVAATLTFSASSPIFAYASVLDNETSDPVTIVAVEDQGVPVMPLGL